MSGKGNPGGRHPDSGCPGVGSVSLDALAAWGSRTLCQAGIDPRTTGFESRELLADALHADASRLRVWMAMGEGLEEAAGKGGMTPEQAGAAYRRLIARRSSREPLQWIEGHAPFRFLDLEVGRGVFIPRPETELVAGAVIDWLAARSREARKRGGQSRPLVIDLCAGSGAIGLSVASEVPGARVLGVERNPEAFSWLERNARTVSARLPTGSSYQPVLGDATDPGLAERLGLEEGSADAVVSNPPYVPESEPVEQPEAAQDPRDALYGGSEDGMRIPRLVVAEAARLVRQDGLFAMEHDISQVRAVRAVFLSEGFTRVSVHRDGTGRPRWTQGLRGGARKASGQDVCVGE